MTRHNRKLKIVHLMRTYGAHGGEQQLSQYFGAEPRGNVSELFAFIYADEQCRLIFGTRAPQLQTVNLWAQEQTPASAWKELLLLIAKLPIIQARFLGLVLKSAPDVCVVNGFQGALTAWPAAALRRRTSWIYVHRITKSRTGSAFPFRLIYWPFNVVAGNSRAVTESLAPLTRQGKLAVLDNGLDWQRFDSRAAEGTASPLPSASGPVLIAVGRLLPHKGQALLVAAFNSVAPDFPSAQLWIAGDGPELETLCSLIAASPVKDRIHLLGRRDDIPAVLARADIFVNASGWEGLSNAVLEGMAAGLPSIVADAPGVTECHVAGETGLVVSRDSAQIALAIRALLMNKTLRVSMGLAARKRVTSKYSMEACRNRYLLLFNKLAKR